VLYLHGGAYVAGSHVTHRGIASALARVAGADVVLPEYRLAPEHLFPAPVEDALATYRWLLATGTDPGRLVLAGDSAGGGLAVATAVAVRDEGLPRAAGILGLSPWVDLTASGPSIEANDELDPWIDGRLVRIGGAAYAPRRTDDPLASPLFADHTDLPPMLVHVGTHEVLLDDARRIVQSARAAGVPAELGEFEGMWHVFQAILGLPETTRSLREAGGWIRRVTDDPASASLSSLVGAPAHDTPAPPPDMPDAEGGD
jgi:monoterpene epsilon-lactone hydrolase